MLSYLSSPATPLYTPTHTSSSQLPAPPRAARAHPALPTPQRGGHEPKGQLRIELRPRDPQRVKPPGDTPGQVDAAHGGGRHGLGIVHHEGGLVGGVGVIESQEVAVVLVLGVGAGDEDGLAPKRLRGQLDLCWRAGGWVGVRLFDCGYMLHHTTTTLAI